MWKGQPQWFGFGFAARNAAFCAKDPRKAWATIKAMRAYAKAHPCCAYSGKRKHLDVHHIHPISKRPDLAAVPSNFMMLARKIPAAHLVVGHLGNYQHENPMVKEMCELAEIARTLTSTGTGANSDAPSVLSG